MKGPAVIKLQTIAAAEYIIDRSGAVDVLLDGRRRSRRGRKTNRDHWRLYLLGGLLTVQERGNFVITDIHRTLVDRLPFDEQFRLGVRRWATDPDSGERYLEIISKTDLDNVTKAINRSLGYGRHSGRGLDDTERARRRAVIQDYSDALMDVFDLGWASDVYAIDATNIWSWARGKAKQHPTRPDATPGPHAGPVVETDDLDTAA